MKKEEIRERLFELGDPEYHDFQCKLMPTVSPENVIGVRTPVLRALAKEIYKSGDYEDFLAELPHRYYDEMNLHGFIISEMKDYNKAVLELDRFLPYVDNWATCDSTNPKKAFSKHLKELEKEACRWLSSSETYTIRFGIGILMGYYLDEAFRPEFLSMVADISSEEYYINMMRAWYFATALAKQYDATVPYIEKHILDEWTHKKSIQKARESYRITPEQKEYLNSLK